MMGGNVYQSTSNKNYDENDTKCNLSFIHNFSPGFFSTSSDMMMKPYHGKGEKTSYYIKMTSGHQVGAVESTKFIVIKQFILLESFPIGFPNVFDVISF